MKLPELITPKRKDIDELIIPLPSLRAALIEEMKKRQEMPLTELLELIHQVYHEENN